MGKTLFGRSVLLAIMGCRLKALPASVSKALCWPSVYSESIAGSPAASKTPWLAWKATIRAAVSVIDIAATFGTGAQCDEAMELLADVVPSLGQRSRGFGSSRRHRRRGRARARGDSLASLESDLSTLGEASTATAVSSDEVASLSREGSLRAADVHVSPRSRQGSRGSTRPGSRRRSLSSASNRSASKSVKLGVCTLSGQTRIDCVVAACCSVLKAVAGDELHRILLIDDPHLLDRCSIALLGAVRSILRVCLRAPCSPACVSTLRRCQRTALTRAHVSPPPDACRIAPDPHRTCSTIVRIGDLGTQMDRASTRAGRGPRLGRQRSAESAAPVCPQGDDNDEAGAASTR